MPLVDIICFLISDPKMASNDDPMAVGTRQHVSHESYHLNLVNCIRSPALTLS